MPFAQESVLVSLSNLHGFTYLHYLSDPLSHVPGQNLGVKNNNRTEKNFLFPFLA